jgi:hypothetical protein
MQRHELRIMAKLNLDGVFAMVGRQSSRQYKFFLSGFSFEKQIRKDRMLPTIRFV